MSVSGLNPEEMLESLLVLNDGSLIGLVMRKNGQPPVRLVDVNPQTGQISYTNRVNLPTTERFSTLAQCPDGTIYTTSVGLQGETSLVQLDLAQKQPVTIAQLRLNNQAWNNGLSSLVCSTAGQLFALGALWHEFPKYLHTVDRKTGEMTRLQAFDVAKITTSRQ